jgi:precorrin-2 dehydrogenase/sirohydrochlorin ferrochelatase
MFPAMLDLSRLPVVLVGSGPMTERRLVLLDEDCAENVTVYAPAPSGALKRLAGKRLRQRWPTPAEAAGGRVLLIADGVETGLLHHFVAAARAGGILVNVEDRPELCDFHSPATIRRGDLLLTVSTGGRSPALARRLGHFLAEIFGPEWQPRLERLARLRTQWREAGADSPTVGARTEAWIERQGLLPDSAAPAAAAAQLLHPLLAAS